MKKIFLAVLLLFVKLCIAGAISKNVEIIQGGFGFIEGPVYKNNKLFFSDIPKSIIYVYDGKNVAEYIKPSFRANGLALDLDNNLLACRTQLRQVAKILENGEVEVLAQYYDGKMLNSPNDLALKSNGDIYFTDPTFNNRENLELDFNGIYKINKKTSEVELLYSKQTGPNGIAFSPDEKKLYVSDSKEMALYKFEVKPDGSLGERVKIGENLKSADGMVVSKNGDVYCSYFEGIAVFDKNDKFLGTIKTPQAATNCTLVDDKTLYITCRKILCKVEL